MPQTADSFNVLDEDSVLIRALVGSYSNDDCHDELDALIDRGGAVSSVAKDHLALMQLRSGEMSAWTDCHAAKGDDELSTTMRYQSWINAPEDAELWREQGMVQARLDRVHAAITSLEESLKRCTEDPVRFKTSALIQELRQR